MTTPTIKPPVVQQSLTPRPTPETDALVRPYIGSMDKPTIDDISRLLDKARALERQRDEALSQIARLRGSMGEAMDMLKNGSWYGKADYHTAQWAWRKLQQALNIQKGGGA